jgi:hypothetical protein
MNSNLAIYLMAASLASGSIKLIQDRAIAEEEIEGS